jgi:hypothetical protein
VIDRSLRESNPENRIVNLEQLANWMRRDAGIHLDQGLDEAQFLRFDIGLALKTHQRGLKYDSVANASRLLLTMFRMMCIYMQDLGSMAFFHYQGMGGSRCF